MCRLDTHHRRKMMGSYRSLTWDQVTRFSALICFNRRAQSGQLLAVQRSVSSRHTPSLSSSAVANL
ncbi:hypothetical protein PSP6_440172 [Paraburkholderia tropica]|nr:hypothetical protein PSP6_440172 [Paraburkholderia tropica]